MDPQSIVAVQLLMFSSEQNNNMQLKINKSGPLTGGTIAK